MTEKKSGEPIVRFDENGRLSPTDWERLLNQLDEEIRQAEEASARKAGWSEAADELFFFDEIFEEEGCETDAEEEEMPEDPEEMEMELDLDAF